MAVFTVGMTDTVALNDSIKLEYEAQFIIAANQTNVIDEFVQYKKDIGAKSIQMTKYGKLALATTPLIEKDDPDSEAMTDSAILLTPVEYGKAITTTRLVDLQTGGQDSLAAMQVVAINMAETKNKLGTVALEASTNVLYADGTGTGTIVAGDIMTGTLLNQVYNKLSRINVQKINGAYVALMHDDVIHDLRAASAAGDWIDVSKYARPEDMLNNEVGMFKGFRIVRNNNALLTADAGAVLVDVYKTVFLGFNGLGLAESMTPQITITGPFDKHARFVNIGWYGTLQYKIVDPDAVWVLESASSVGVNV